MRLQYYKGEIEREKKHKRHIVFGNYAKTLEQLESHEQAQTH